MYYHFVLDYNNLIKIYTEQIYEISSLFINIMSIYISIIFITINNTIIILSQAKYI